MLHLGTILIRNCVSLKTVQPTNAPTCAQHQHDTFFAGSESFDSSSNTAETIAINSGLLWLGNVLRDLADVAEKGATGGGKNGGCVVNFNNHNLTRFLEVSCGRGAGRQASNFGLASDLAACELHQHVFAHARRPSGSTKHALLPRAAVFSQHASARFLLLSLPSAIPPQDPLPALQLYACALNHHPPYMPSCPTACSNPLAPETYPTTYSNPLAVL